MHLNSKLHSFSLVEMLVVMVVGGMAIGIIYYAYYTVFTYQHQLEDKYDLVNDASDLYFQLNKDFGHCRYATVTEEQELVCREAIAGTTVRYRFTSEYCLRRQLERLDTFRCTLGRPQYRWRGKPLAEAGEDGQPGIRLTDEVSIEVTGLLQPVTFLITRQYDAAALLEVTTLSTDTLP